MFESLEDYTQRGFSAVQVSFLILRKNDNPPSSRSQNPPSYADSRVPYKMELSRGSKRGELFKLVHKVLLLFYLRRVKKEPAIIPVLSGICELRTKTERVTPLTGAGHLPVTWEGGLHQTAHGPDLPLVRE